MKEALLVGPEPKVIIDSAEPMPVQPSRLQESTAAFASSDTSAESSAGFDSIQHSDATSPQKEHAPVNSETSASSKPAAMQPASNDQPDLKIDLSQLIAPEIWADLLPRRVEIKADRSSVDGGVPSQVTPFPAPPTDDTALISALVKDDTTSSSKLVSEPLQVHVADCRLHDVTTWVRKQIVNNELDIDFVTLHDLIYETKNPGNFRGSLSIAYQYGEGPVRLAATNSLKLLSITPESDNPLMTPRTWNADAWSVMGASYGGKAYVNDTEKKILEYQIRRKFQDYKSRSLKLADSMFAEARYEDANQDGVVFYTSENLSHAPILAAVGVPDQQEAHLTASLELPIFDVATAVEKARVASGSTTPNRTYVEIPRDRIRVKAGKSPIITFANGVKFYLHEYGRFYAQDKSLKSVWKVQRAGEERADDLELHFTVDDKIEMTAGGKQVFYISAIGTDRVVFVNESPWFVVVRSNGEWVLGKRQ